MSAPNQNATLVVQRLDRATDLLSSTGLPIKCLVFPTTGGVQAIDAAGTILPLVGATGSLIPSADNVDDLGSTALRWRKLFVGTSIDTPALLAGGVGNVDLTVSATGTGSVALTSPETITPGAVATGVQTALTLTGAANTGVTAATEASDVYLNLARTVTWAAGAGPLAAQRAVRFAAPTYAGNAGTPLVITAAATVYIDAAPTQGANMTLTNTYALWVDAGATRLDGSVLVTPPAQVGGTPYALRLDLTTATYTGITTLQEASDVAIDLDRVVTWATGNVTIQRAIQITRPEYAAAGASTFTTAASLWLKGAPIAGSLVTIARSYALMVAEDVSNFAGGIGVSVAATGTVATALSVVRLVDSTTAGVAGVGAAGVGARISITAPNDLIAGGAQTEAGFATGFFPALPAAGAEAGVLSLGGSFAGTGSEALRLIGVTGDIVTRVDITPATTGVDPIIAGNGEANTGLILRARGTGNVSLQGSGAADIVSVDTDGGSRLGFYGIGPVTRQVLATGAGATADNIITALQNLGLLAQA